MTTESAATATITRTTIPTTASTSLAREGGTAVSRRSSGCAPAAIASSKAFAAAGWFPNRSTSIQPPDARRCRIVVTPSSP